jgi:porphobilinogen deaminase
MKKIVIGITNKGLVLNQANTLKSIIEHKGYECEIVFVGSIHDSFILEDTGIDDNKTHPETAALLDGSVDVAISPLNQISTSQPEGLVIGALSQRGNPQNILILSPDAVDPDQILKLKTKSKIECSYPLVQAQLSSLRPDLSISNKPKDVYTLLNQLKDGSISGFVISAIEKDEFNDQFQEHFPVNLHPHEFIPSAGQGVNAYRCLRENIELRKILRDVHHPEVSTCTNVERRLLKHFDINDQPSIGVYCKRDIAGNYHVYASYVIDKYQAPIFVKISQSTTFGLDQKLYQLIQEKLNKFES